MRLRSIIAGVVLLVLTTSGVGAHEPESAIPTREVLVAADFIPAGEPIQPDMVSLRMVPVDESNALTLTEPSEVLGTVAAISIVAAQPITPFMVSPVPGTLPPDPALDALSDAEHFGVFTGHFAYWSATWDAISEEFVTVGELLSESMPEHFGDLDARLAALQSDPDTVATVLEFLDGVAAAQEAEVAWLEDHPPRRCYATIHALVSDGMDGAVANFRDMATAIRTQDAELLTHATAVAEARSRLSSPDFANQTCWTPPDE